MMIQMIFDLVCYVLIIAGCFILFKGITDHFIETDRWW